MYCPKCSAPGAQKLLYGAACANEKCRWFDKDFNAKIDWGTNEYGEATVNGEPFEVFRSWWEDHQKPAW